MDTLKCYSCQKLPKFSKICDKCKKCILCVSCLRTNYIRIDQCPECCISEPNFVNLPRNIENFKETIEV